MERKTFLAAVIASLLTLSLPGACEELGAVLERVSSPDIQVDALRDAARAADVPPVPQARDVELTAEQRAMLIEASMVLEAGMVEDLRKQTAEWAKTNSPEKVNELLHERIIELAGTEKYRSLFGDPSDNRPDMQRSWRETVNAFQSRSLPDAAPVQNPNHQQIMAALSARPQDSAAAESSGSAEEVYKAHKATFVKICQKYSDVDKQGEGFPRAILGILRAETNFGQGCDRSRSGSCGSPSPVSRAMNGAQRNAALRIGAKGMFGPWQATTAPASSAGAAGICQFLPGTAEGQLAAFRRDFGGDGPNLFGFDGCVPMVAIYLKDYLDKHHGARSGIENAVRAYNGGAGFNPNNKETKGYHATVVKSMQAQAGVPQTCREILAPAGN